jgi:hypothetical protein
VQPELIKERIKTMKNLFVLFLLTSGFCTSAFAWKETGGGDEVALDFQRSFATALRAVQEGKIGGIFTANQLLEVSQKTKIMVVEERLTVESGGIQQDSIAVNDPASAQIRINRARWNGLKDGHLKEAVALHEMLSLLRIERTGYYEYSAKYLESLGLSPWTISGGEGSRAADPKERTLTCQLDYSDGVSDWQRQEISVKSKDNGKQMIRSMEARGGFTTKDGRFGIEARGTSPFSSAYLPKPYEYINIRIRDQKLGTIALTGPIADSLATRHTYQASGSFYPPDDNGIAAPMVIVDCKFE